MSVEAKLAHADLMAAGLMAEKFGLAAFASERTFALPYEELRDLIALAYLRGSRDAMRQAARIVKAS